MINMAYCMYLLEKELAKKRKQPKPKKKCSKISLLSTNLGVKGLF